MRQQIYKMFLVEPRRRVTIIQKEYLTVLPVTGHVSNVDLGHDFKSDCCVAGQEFGKFVRARAFEPCFGPRMLYVQESLPASS